MPKLTINQWCVLGLIGAVLILLGEWQGVRDYKALCEPMGDKYQVMWLECKE